MNCPDYRGVLITECPDITDVPLYMYISKELTHCVKSVIVTTYWPMVIERCLFIQVNIWGQVERW